MGASDSRIAVVMGLPTDAEFMDFPSHPSGRTLSGTLVGVGRSLLTCRPIGSLSRCEMRMRWMTSSALALAVSSAVPALANAAGGLDLGAGRPAAVRVDRDEWHEHERERRDFQEAAEVKELPERVRETIDHERNGRKIVSAERIRRGEERFYRIHLEGHHKKDLTLRVAPDGKLLDMEKDE